MKIIKLSAENIKRLKVFEIEPDGNLIVIGGKNGVGKSSALDSISYALEGKGAICEEPLRRGEKKGRIVCELDDLVITRTFTKTGGGTLTVNSRDNKQKFTSPQAMLDSLIGKLGFDPLAFSRMDGRRQLETLKNLVNLDFGYMDSERQRIYDERTAINHNVTNLRSNYDGIALFPDAPKEEVSVAALVDELEKIREHNDNIQVEKQTLNGFERTSDLMSENISQLETQIADLEKQIDNANRKHDELNCSHKERLKIQQITQRKIDGMVEMDETETRAEISNAEETNKQVRSNQGRKEIKEKLEIEEGKSKSLSNQIDEIDTNKEKILANTEFPVPDLSFDQSRVLINNLPFDQAASSEKLKVSVAMGIAMNPKLKVLLIRDGSLLDEDSLKMIAEMAEKADSQIWIERVSEGKECQVIIEDGMIKEGVKDEKGRSRRSGKDCKS